MPPLDVDERRPVWTALSEFWLDSEMTSAGAHYVVREVLASPYSVDQAEAIHWTEVAPALAGNLYPFNVAGEWAMFDPDWLAAECARVARRRRPGWFRAVANRWHRAKVGDLPDVVFERARRAERDGLPPIPTESVPLVVSRNPVRFRVPW